MPAVGRSHKGQRIDGLKDLLQVPPHNPNMSNLGAIAAPDGQKPGNKPQRGDAGGGTTAGVSATGRVWLPNDRRTGGAIKDKPGSGYGRSR